jgi:hypothetical protein
MPSILIISDKYLALVDRLQIRKSHFINRFYLIDLSSAVLLYVRIHIRTSIDESHTPCEKGSVERAVGYVDITIEAFEHYTTLV